MKFMYFKMVILSIALVGCQSAPYRTQYTLADVQSAVEPAHYTKPYSIVVMPVRSFGGSMNTDMIYTRSPNVLESYTKSAWADTPAELIKTSIANGLIASNGFKGVVMAPTAVTSPYKVETTIQKMLQTFENGRSFVELNLMVRLVNNSSQNLVYSTMYSAKEMANSLDAAGGVEAYNRALKRLIPDIVQDINRH